MKKTNIFRYYAFGFDYGLINRDGLLNFETKEAINILDGFFDSIDELDLQVTQNACDDLRGIYKELKKNKDSNVNEDMSKKIKKEIDRIDIVLDSELKLKIAYQLTEKRYSLNKLLNSPQKLLADNVYNKLNDHTKKDFDFACIQIALSQPTASAFHVMRALEEQVKLLYFHYKKTHRLSQPMWGPMIQELRAKRKPKPSDKLLDFLDSIRRHYRNPTQHPDLFYTLDDAQDLLNQAISAINMIDSET